MESLFTNFEKYIAENSLLSADDRVLVAVSGGVDSMVLLSLMARTGREIAVAHCNFGLRGKEADEDEVAVQQTAQSLGVPFFNRRFDTLGEMERTGEGVQAAARRLRYTWFEELCREHGYTVVAIAHHADDSIETFFINLFRGTGLKGLTGISIVNGRVIRPLLFATRRDILDYAAANKIHYREDSSNRSTKYLRNKIRLGIIPRLLEISPRFGATMGQNVQHLTAAQLFINHGIELIRRQVEERRGGLVYIHPERIDKGYPVGFVIYELLNDGYGFKGDVVDALVESLRAGTSGKRFYARDHVAYIDRGAIIVAPIGDDDPCMVQVTREMRKAYAGNSSFLFDYMDIDAVESLETPPEVALLDADKLTFPLEIRRWQDGDSFEPFGMKGTKKVSDLLIDQKVPVAEKRRQFVITSGGEIAWVAGRRLDNRFRIGPETENVLRIIKEII
jgi:tRNA(Ile)-lysidine synthase